MELKAENSGLWARAWAKSLGVASIQTGILLEKGSKTDLPCSVSGGGDPWQAALVGLRRPAVLEMESRRMYLLDNVIPPGFVGALGAPKVSKMLETWS